MGETKGAIIFYGTMPPTKHSKECPCKLSVLYWAILYCKRCYWNGIQLYYKAAQLWDVLTVFVNCVWYFWSTVVVLLKYWCGTFFELSPLNMKVSIQQYFMQKNTYMTLSLRTGSYSLCGILILITVLHLFQGTHK